MFLNAGTKTVTLSSQQPQFIFINVDLYFLFHTLFHFVVYLFWLLKRKLNVPVFLNQNAFRNSFEIISGDTTQTVGKQDFLIKDITRDTTFVGSLIYRIDALARI